MAARGIHAPLVRPDFFAFAFGAAADADAAELGSLLDALEDRLQAHGTARAAAAA